MSRYRLTLEYHGAPFVGWQRQSVGASVQGALEEALTKLEPAPVRVHGAGRTDAGVHASGQVAHCDLARDWAPDRLREALNHHLRPAPVAVTLAARAADTFHSRFDAVERRYLYRIINRRAPLTLEAGLAWRVVVPLDVAAMRAGAGFLLGSHDFTTFRASQCQAASPVRTLDRISVTRTGEAIDIRLSARSFLHNQVRSIVGTLARVGAGAWPAGRVGEALAARDRRACGPVAPACGLYLTDVIYPGD